MPANLVENDVELVMSGSASDKLDWLPHIRSKARREELAKAFKKANNRLRGDGKAVASGRRYLS